MHNIHFSLRCTPPWSHMCYNRLMCLVCYLPSIPPRRAIAKLIHGSTEPENACKRTSANIKTTHDSKSLHAAEEFIQKKQCYNAMAWLSTVSVWPVKRLKLVLKPECEMTSGFISPGRYSTATLEQSSSLLKMVETPGMCWEQLCFRLLFINSRTPSLRV